MCPHTTRVAPHMCPRTSHAAPHICVLILRYQRQEAKDIGLMDLAADLQSAVVKFEGMQVGCGACREGGGLSRSEGGGVKLRHEYLACTQSRLQLTRKKKKVSHMHLV